MTNALNAFLYNTGTETSQFMVVLATNRPGDLDVAVLDQVDDHLQFGLPDLPQRKKLVQAFFEKYLGRDQDTSQGGGLFTRLFRGANPLRKNVVITGVNAEHLDEIARVTGEFSGKGLAKLMIAVQGFAFGCEEPRISCDDMMRVVQWCVQQFQNRGYLRDVQRT